MKNAKYILVKTLNHKFWKRLCDVKFQKYNDLGMEENFVQLLFFIFVCILSQCIASLLLEKKGWGTFMWWNGETWLDFFPKTIIKRLIFRKKLSYFSNFIRCFQNLEGSTFILLSERWKTEWNIYSALVLYSWSKYIFLNIWYVTFIHFIMIGLQVA